MLRGSPSRPLQRDGDVRPLQRWAFRRDRARIQRRLGTQRVGHLHLHQSRYRQLPRNWDHRYRCLRSARRRSRCDHGRDVRRRCAVRSVRSRHRECTSMMVIASLTRRGRLILALVSVGSHLPFQGLHVALGGTAHRLLCIVSDDVAGPGRPGPVDAVERERLHRLHDMLDGLR